MNGSQAVVAGLGVLAVLALGLAAPMVDTAVEGATATALDGEVDDRNGTDTPLPESESLANLPNDSERVTWRNDTGEGNASPGDGDGSADGGGILSVSNSPLAALAAVALLAVVAVALAVGTGSAGTPDPRDDDDEDEGDPATLADVGTAAGRAADRMVEADPENAVYRAWVDMTGLLDVPDPETTTPGEFAAAAVDAGMDPEDVERLTGAFEAVRYGGDEVTTDHERSAREAFRRIEAAYADHDTTAPDGREDIPGDREATSNDHEGAPDGGDRT